MSITNDHPYSPACQAGEYVFASGSLSVDGDYRPVTGRRAALDAAMTILGTRLAAGGATLRDVVKLTYFVTDMTLRDEANAQFREVWPHGGPARTFVGAAQLPYGASVEIEAVAFKGDR